MTTIISIAQIAVNPESLRQALELVFGVNSETNQWGLSTGGGAITLYNSTSYEVTEDDFKGFVEAIAAIDEFLQEDYVFDKDTKSFTENLPVLRAKAKVKIDDEAGKARLRYLTSIPGQDATYIAKELQCRAYKAANYPDDLTGYEWVKSEVDATGLSSKDAADAMVLQADQWVMVGSAIEKVRRGGKIDVDKKLKASTIKASLAATITALQAI